MRGEVRQDSVVLGGKYVLGECIGSGGMGSVYRANHPSLGRQVAIKVLHHAFAKDPRVAEHFRLEAMAAARFSHPNSVGVLDYGESDDGSPFLVMEYVHGRTLSQLVRVGSPFEIERGVAIIRQVLDALGEAHQLGIVHADVKSDNVLIEVTRDRGEQAKLVDFGLARISSERREAVEEAFISGTPEYMAPEVIRGEPPTPSSDLYAVGAMFYELLTGATPFGGGDHLEVMRRHISDLVVPPSLRCPEHLIPPHIERAVMRALEKEPARRYGSAAEFSADLAARIPRSGPSALRQCTAPSVAGTDAISTVMLPMPSDRQRGSGHRLARGSDPAPMARGSGDVSPSETSMRRQIGAAIQSGSAREVAAGYLALAELLCALHRPRNAAAELEEALDILGGPSSANRAQTELIMMAMVRLYLEVGDHNKAAKISRSLDNRSTVRIARS